MGWHRLCHSCATIAFFLWRKCQCCDDSNVAVRVMLLEWFIQNIIAAFALALSRSSQNSGLFIWTLLFNCYVFGRPFGHHAVTRDLGLFFECRTWKEFGLNTYTMKLQSILTLWKKNMCKQNVYWRFTYKGCRCNLP